MKKRSCKRKKKSIKNNRFMMKRISKCIKELDDKEPFKFMIVDDITGKPLIKNALNRKKLDKHEIEMLLNEDGLQ